MQVPAEPLAAKEKTSPRSRMPAVRCWICRAKVCASLIPHFEDFDAFCVVAPLCSRCILTLGNYRCLSASISKP